VVPVAGPRSSDERPHPSDAPWFTERWRFTATARSGAPAVDVDLGLRAGLGDAWFVARLTGPGPRLVTVVDHALAPPAPPGLEIRAPGLWADHVIEEPRRRWSLGLEAFGVAVAVGEVSESALLDPELRGERVAVGWELEWENDEDPEWDPPTPGWRSYSARCAVHGEVLVGADRFEVDTSGRREHAWGG
jgi:hypothetical protein